MGGNVSSRQSRTTLVTVIRPILDRVSLLNHFQWRTDVTMSQSWQLTSCVAFAAVGGFRMHAAMGTGDFGIQQQRYSIPPTGRIAHGFVILSGIMFPGNGNALGSLEDLADGKTKNPRAAGAVDSF